MFINIIPMKKRISNTPSEEQKDVWIKTKNNEIVTMKNNEKNFSYHIAIKELLQNTGSQKKSPLLIDIHKKDLKIFQELLRKPLLLSELPIKKYTKALTISLYLQSPLLYTALLSAKLPQNVTDNITRKYISLCDITPSTLISRMFSLPIKHTTFNPTYHDKMILFAGSQSQSNDILTPPLLLPVTNEIIIQPTLLQTVALTIVRNKNNYTIPIKICPHMIGYDEFSHFYIQYDFCSSKSFIEKVNLKEIKLGSYCITALHINV